MKMENKRGLKELLKNNFISLIVIVILISLGAVIAGNVIVKEGNIDVTGTGNFSGTIFINNGTDVSNLGASVWQNGTWIQLKSGMIQRVNISNKLFINGSNVGIGISNPVKTLDLNGVYGIDGKNVVSALHPWNILWSRDSSGGLQIYESTGYYPRVTFLDNGNVGIGTTTPLYPLHVSRNTSLANQSISIFAQGNISATGFILRTSIFDKSRGNALDLVKDAEEYKNVDGTINHKVFYGYAGEMSDVDYSRPETKEVCNEGECKIETTYPYTKQVEGVELGMEIDVLRQAVYELKIQNQELKNRIEVLENK